MGDAILSETVRYDGYGVKIMTTKQKCHMKQVVGNYLQKFECLQHKVDLDVIERIAQRLGIARDCDVSW